MNSKLQLRQISAKCGILAQEAVAGMDRLDVGHLGGGDEPRDVQVAVGAGGLADADGPVGQSEVGGVAVGLRVDRDHLDAQLLAGADDPQGDLATVGHQDPLKHRRTSPQRVVLNAVPAGAIGRPSGRDRRGTGAGRTRPAGRS